MIGKFLLLVAVITIAWFGFRYLAERDRIRASVSQAKRDGTKRQQDELRRRDAAADLDMPPSTAEDLVKCPACGTYVAPRRAVGCGRTECPYGAARA